MIGAQFLVDIHLNSLFTSEDLNRIVVPYGMQLNTPLTVGVLYYGAPYRKRLMEMHYFAIARKCTISILLDITRKMNAKI